MVALSPISVNTEIGSPEDDRNFYLQSLDYGNGDGVNYTYDSQGRLTSQTYEDGDNVTYQYDNDGALAVMTDSATGITTRYYYDFTGRTMKYTESASGYSHSVEYGYDTINNLTSQKEIINGVTQTTSYTYDSSNRVTSKTTNGITVEYTYDALGRISQQVTKNGSTVILTETYTYVPNSSRIASCRTVATNYDITYSYTYDDNGNILSVNDGLTTIEYRYDSANQLIRENNPQDDFTRVWTYDDAGNILTAQEYDQTSGEPEYLRETVTYSYDEVWGDLLTAYNGANISYDGIGNPTSYKGMTLTWEHGRELTTLSNGTTTWTYTYDANGMRTKRTNGTNTYTYVYSGSQLVQMTVDGHTLSFTYDAAGTPVTLTADGTVYYYLTNLQGDVTGILNANGERELLYEYDAWGKILYTNDCDDVLAYNPLRYRGYVFDEETELYYLQSRYYDPVVGRFINADAMLTGQGLLGNNMFAYCLNNPIFHKDPTGHCPEGIEEIIEAFANIYKIIKKLFTPKQREYISDQSDSSIKNKKFGWSTVGKAGCAAVACYNALITLGDSQSFNRVLNYFNENEEKLIFNGLLGTTPFLIVDFFEANGYEAEIITPFDDMNDYSRLADACIMFYFYPYEYGPITVQLAHYFHYKRVGDSYYSYNDGGNHSFDSISSYMNDQNESYLYLGIYIYK